MKVNRVVDVTSIGDTNVTRMTEDVPLATGCNVEIVAATAPRGRRVLVNGQELRGIQEVELKMKAYDATELTMKCLWPYPFQVGPDGDVVTRTFKGVFVEEEDYKEMKEYRKMYWELKGQTNEQT